MRPRTSDETSVNESFSGIKRVHPPSTPTFGDLPSPMPVSSSKQQFFKVVPFPRYNEDDKISSPAPKMIKRESVTPLKLDPISTQPRNGSSTSGSESGSGNTSPSSHSSSENDNNHFKGFQSSSTDTRSAGNLFQYYQKPTNQNVPHLFSIPKQEATSFRPFCYNCKQYGHVKRDCRCRWYHWWPQEYLFRFPWLRRRIREANQLRWQGRMSEYRIYVKKTDEDVEEQDQKKQHLFSEYRTNSNWNGPQRYYQQGQFTARSRADGQKILHAIRRQSPQRLPPQPSCCPTQHEFSFNCQGLIEDLRRQVEELRMTLNVISSKSVSPPACTGNNKGQLSRFNFSMPRK